MSRCVPSWDLEDINQNNDIFKLDYEVAELTWENGHLAMHELSNPRVRTKSHPITSWDKPRAAETLEAIVNQATNKTTINTITADGLNASAVMTSDALVPVNSNKKTGDKSGNGLRLIKSVRDAGCSTRVGSCSGEVSAFGDRRVAVPAVHDWSSCRDLSVSGSGTVGTFDTYNDNLGGQRLTSTSTGSPENMSSGGDCYKSTSPDDSGCNCKTQRDTNEEKETKRSKAKSSISNKRRRTAAIHNQSERKRRDKINQRMTTLQKMVPNSSKTDKSSMLDEVIEYVKQLQAQLHLMNRMNISPMMMSSLVMQQQQQMQMSMMNSMGMGMGMGTGTGTGMGMGGLDMNTMGLPNIQAGFLPSTFMHMPSWNVGPTTDRIVNPSAMPIDPMSAFLASRPQPMNMDAYSRMADLYRTLWRPTS